MAEVEEYLDFLQFSESSLKENERLEDVATILKCIQGLMDHIAYLENEHIVEHRINKKNELKNVDLGLIRYQMWLSAAHQKLMTVERELEWNRQDWCCPEEAHPLPTAKCILDDSIIDGLDTPLVPERIWVDSTIDEPSYDSTYVSLPPHISTLHTLDSKECTVKVETIDTNNDSETQIDNNQFKKRVDLLRAKLKMKEDESYNCPKTYDSKSITVLSNLKHLEGNMTELKKLLKLLAKGMEVSPAKYGQIQNTYEGIITQLEGSKRNSEDNFVKQKILKMRSQPTTQLKKHKDTLKEITPIKSRVHQAVTHNNDLSRRALLFDPEVLEKYRRQKESVSKYLYYT